MKVKAMVILVAMLLIGGNCYAAGDLIVSGNINQIPSGTIMMYGGATLPADAGWLIADGSAISRTTYAELFGAIGTTYGAGDGSTTFNLPDFRGIFPKGAGSQTINGIGYSGARGVKINDTMQGHGHEFNWNAQTAGSNMSIWASGPNGAYLPQTSLWRDRNFNVGSPITDTANGMPRTGTTTEPASLGVNFIIKL